MASPSDTFRLPTGRGGSAAAAFAQWAKRSGVTAQVLSLALIVLFFAIGSHGRNLSWTNIQVVLSLAAVPAILAVGLHITIVIGGIDLSLQGAVALCAVFIGLLTKNEYNSYNLGLWIIPASIALGGLCGGVTGLLHTRLRIPSFITTLGMSWVLYGLAVYIDQAKLIALHDGRIQAFINQKPLGISNLAVIAVVVAVVMQYCEDRTRFGRHLYAVGGNEALSRQAGVNVSRIKTLAFCIAGCFYGLGALLLVSQMGTATSRTGLNLLFPVITAVAVGGVSLTGGLGGAKNAALGALIIAVLNNGMVLMVVSPYAQDAVNGVVLITAVAVTLDRKKLGFIK